MRRFVNTRRNGTRSVSPLPSRKTPSDIHRDGSMYRRMRATASSWSVNVDKNDPLRCDLMALDEHLAQQVHVSGRTEDLMLIDSDVLADVGVELACRALFVNPSPLASNLVEGYMFKRAAG